MLTELSKKELLEIEGGHEGTAYAIGQVIGASAHLAWDAIRSLF